MPYTLLVFVLRRKGENQRDRRKRRETRCSLPFTFCCPPPKNKAKCTKKGFDFSIHSYIVTFAAAHKSGIYTVMHLIALEKEKSFTERLPLKYFKDMKTRVFVL